MRLHADFSQPIVIPPKDYHWLKSPGGEVNRMMLDRIGEEKARATSLVEFAPQSKFPEHAHPWGEEVLVLSGVFTENDHQHYPAGWYMRNPHGSAHRVSSETGCRIFVKLMQMTEEELEPTRLNTHDPRHWIEQKDGRQRCPLFESTVEKTYLEKLAAHQVLTECVENGIEILVISGELATDLERYPTGTWLRLPPHYELKLHATELGATLYVKCGHLADAMQLWGNDSTHERITE